MKVILNVLILLVLTVSGSFCQGKATISGRIIEQSTSEPLAFATVSLHAGPDSAIISGVLSDKVGRFVFSDIPRGNYSIRISFIGFAQKSVDILVGELNNTYDLGKIELIETASSLDEVVIEAKRAIISSELDRKTFSVQDNPAQSGGSVLDFMKALPGITVDQEGKVLLRGSDKVSVLIDGKQSSLTGFGTQKGLDNIPAGNIEMIEIINNPSAKYDASGMAGIINIIYKKEKDTGFNGDIRFTYGLGQLARRKDDVPGEFGSYNWNPRYMPGLSLNYKTGRINSFIQADLMKLRKLPNNEFSTRYYDDGRQTVSQVPENRKQTHYILTGGIDFFINEQNTLSASAIYDYEFHYDTAQVPYVYLNNGLRYRHWGWLEYEITGYMNYSLQYTHKFIEPGHEFNAGIQYTKGWEDESYYLTDSSEFRQSRDTTHIIAKEHTTTLNIDYTRPLAFGRLEAGSKLQLRRIPVTYIVGEGTNSVIYPALGEWSEWGENTLSLYLNYVYEKPVYDIEAGIRAENTNVFYDLADENIYYPKNDRYDYFRLFPNIRLTYKLNDKNNLSVFYNRRIDRPGEPEVRVFPKYDDPELLKVGNPYLRPQLTQSFEVAYKYRWSSGSAFLALYHRIIKDPFSRIYSIDTTNLLYDIINKIYHNTKGATNSGVEAVVTQSFGSGLKLTGSLNWYRNEIKAFKGTLLFPYEREFTIEDNRENTWNAKITSQIMLPWQIQMQLSAVYYAPFNIQQGRQMARSSVDIGINRKFFDNRGEFNISFNDIFNRFGINQKITGDGVTVIYQNYYETQTISAGLKYRF